MSQRTVTIKTADGQCPASLHLPEGSGPSPAVIMYPDAFGLRDTFRSMGERLAGMGYVTLVPDVYYRVGEWAPFEAETAFTDPAERARLMGLMGPLNQETTATDADAFIGYLTALEEVTGTAVGTTGYCMGGGLSLVTAGKLPDGVAAAASFHGGHLANEANPDSAHRLASAIKAEVYVAAAQNDGSFPAEQQELLEQSFIAAGVRYELETYPAGHGFAVPDNPTYDPKAEERHWDALSRLYGKLPR